MAWHGSPEPTAESRTRDGTPVQRGRAPRRRAAPVIPGRPRRARFPPARRGSRGRAGRRWPAARNAWDSKEGAYNQSRMVGTASRTNIALRRGGERNSASPATRRRRSSGHGLKAAKVTPRDNGTPAARPVRKATGLLETAGLPKEGYGRRQCRQPQHGAVYVQAFRRIGRDRRVGRGV